MKRHLLLFVMLLTIVLPALTQNRTVTGRVRDAQGNPIPYATITVKGSNTGVAADQNGNFSIQVPANSSIVVTAAGFQSNEMNTGTLTTLDVQLGVQGNLQEVVITALGVGRTRNTVPYAAQQISGAEVSKNRSSNFLQNLSGKVSGVELRQGNTLGGSTNVVIRGVKSISGNNQALFVVDGVIIDNTSARSANQSTGAGGYDYGSAAADINPDDIESVTILKGAASTALYGSRGGNGVILITTRKGSRGLGVTVNPGVTVGRYDKSTFPKYQTEYGGGYGPYYEDPTSYFLYRDINGDGIKDLVMPTSEDASYGGLLDGRLVYQWDAFDPLSPNYGKPRPWLPAANLPGEVMQTAVSSNQSIMLGGSSETGSFKLGYTRTDDKGILPNSKISKNLINFSATYNLATKLVAGASINYSGINGRGRYGTGYDDKNIMTNFRQWWQVNVDVKEQEEAYKRQKRNITWNWADPTDLTPIYWDNVYFTRFENYETDNRTRFFGNVNLTYKPFEWLNILGRISNDSYTDLQEERQAIGSVTTSSYTRHDRNVQETNYDILLNMERELSANFTLKGLLGTNVRIERRQLMSSSTNGGLVADRIYSLANTRSAITAPVESDVRRQVWGNFAGATVSWKEMLTLDATIRNDRSSTLPENNNSYWYPSVSVSYAFSKLLPGETWLSFGKVRANYAQVGNDAPPYSLIDVYETTPPFGSESQGTVRGTKANPSLRPERTKSYEVGIEAAFLENRFGFDVSYYNATTFDQIFAVPISTATGYNARFLNAGNIRNKGVELSAYVTPVQGRDFSWTMNVNWTRNRNLVEDLYPGIDVITLGNFQGGVSINAALGKPYGTIRGNDFIYTNGQRTVDATGRYMMTTESNIDIGDTTLTGSVELITL